LKSSGTVNSRLAEPRNRFFGRFSKRHQFGDGLPRLGDNDLLAHGDAFEQAGEVGFGLVDIDFHEVSVAKSWTKSIICRFSELPVGAVEKGTVGENLRVSKTDAQ